MRVIAIFVCRNDVVKRGVVVSHDAATGRFPVEINPWLPAKNGRVWFSHVVVYIIRRKNSLCSNTMRWVHDTTVERRMTEVSDCCQFYHPYIIGEDFPPPFCSALSFFRLLLMFSRREPRPVASSRVTRYTFVMARSRNPIIARSLFSSCCIRFPCKKSVLSLKKINIFLEIVLKSYKNVLTERLSVILSAKSKKNKERKKNYKLRTV